MATAQERPSVRVIADLISSDLHAQGSDPIARVAELWEKHPGVDGMAVLEGPRVLYLSRARFFVQLGKRFGYALFENRPVSMLAEEGSTVESEMDPVEVISIATQREAERIYDDILVLDQRRFRGLVSMRSLLVHHKGLLVNGIAERALLEERNRRLQDVNMKQVEFMGSLTHDLRSPMTTLLGISQNLLADSDTRSRHEKSLRALLLGAQDALSIVNDLQDILKLELGVLVPAPERLDLVALFEDVVTSLQPLVSARATRIDTACGGLPSSWMTDPVFLRRSLSNLLRAAIEESSGAPVVLAARSYGDNLVFTVGGAVGGLTDAERARLFSAMAERSTPLLERQRRTALRLSAVRGLVEKLGGVMVSDGGVGGRAGVTVRLPPCAS